MFDSGCSGDFVRFVVCLLCIVLLDRVCCCLVVGLCIWKGWVGF